jgi:hypothetical protein
MNQFITNLRTIKSLLLKDSIPYKELEYLINMNDELVDCTRIDEESLSEYISIRRKYKESVLDGSRHVEALRRKNMLENIEEDTEYLVRLNEYIRVVLEEKEKPLDSLVSNLEYSEAYLAESNRQMEAYKNRRFRCTGIKKIFKGVCIFIGVALLIHIYKILVN